MKLFNLAIIILLLFNNNGPAKINKELVCLYARLTERDWIQDLVLNSSEYILTLGTNDYQEKIKSIDEFIFSNISTTVLEANETSNYRLINLDSLLKIISDGKALVLNLRPNIYYSNENTAVPKNITLKFEKGALIKGELIVMGDIEAGLFQIFDSSAKVILTGSGIQEVYPEWWGIDGIADDVQINLALQSGKKVIISGQYRLNKYLSVTKSNTMIEGTDGSIIYAPKYHNSHATSYVILVSESMWDTNKDAPDSIKIIGVNIKGSGDKNQRGIYIRNDANFVTIENCTIDSMGITGIEIMNCSNAVVQSNIVSNSTQFNGIGILFGHDNIVQNNHCFGNYDQGIEIRGEFNTSIIGNYCYDNGGNLSSQCSGITIAAEDARHHTYNVLVIGNYCYSNKGVGIRILGGKNNASVSNVTIQNNICVKNVNVTGKIYGDGMEISDGSRLYYVSNIKIVNNVFANNERFGTYLYWVNEIEYKNNAVESNGLVGLKIDGIKKTDISGNKIGSNGNYGISFGGFEVNNVLSENFIYDNNFGGIYLKGIGIKDNSLINNTIKNIVTRNQNYGIYIENIDKSNEIKSNNLFGNDID